MQVGANFAYCPKPGTVPDVFGLSRGIGRSVLLALIGVRMSSLTGGENNALWCDECQRYYNPAAPHKCRDREISANRAQLEQWLGTYTIKEG